MRASITLHNAQQAHQALLALWADIKPWLIAGHRLSVSVKTETRSTAQNSLLWSCLADVSRQVEWHGQRLEPEEWKDFFTAALKRQKVIPGMDGGFVVLGSSTSEMTKEELAEMIEFIYAFGAQKGVTFNES